MEERLDSLLTEIRDRISRFESFLPREIDAMALSQTAKLPFKALVFRETLIWRMTELSRSAVEHFESDRLASAILLTRAAMETNAALWFLNSKVEKTLKTGEIATLDGFLMRLLMGSKTDKELPDAINVMNFIDSVEKNVEGVRLQYERLCEFSHPNWAGTSGLFSDSDQAKRITYFGTNLRGTDSAKGIGVINLSVALGIFEHAYNKFSQLLPSFITFCEKNLKSPELDS